MPFENGVRRALLACCVGVAILAPSTLACTAANDTTATQCRSEEDCRNRGPEFADTTCSLDRVCVPVAAEVTNLCSTNTECTQRAGGAPARCVPSTRTCVPLTTPDCPRVLADQADLLDNNTIYLGAVTLAAIGGKLMENSIEYARDEIRRALGGGLPGATADSPKRPLAFVLCPFEASATGLGALPSARRGVEHLVNALQVPAIVGPYTSVTALAVGNQTIVPKKVVSLLPNSPVHADSYIYSLLGAESGTEPLLQALMDDYLTPRVYADGIAPTGEPLRVQFIYSSDAGSRWVADDIIKKFKFNGKSLVDSGANFLPSHLGDITDRIGNPDVQGKLNAAIAAALTFKPHVIIVQTPSTTANTLMLPIEAQWPAGTPPPLWVSTFTVWRNTIVATIGNRNSLRKRYYGIEATPGTPDQARADAFQIGMRIKFPDLVGQTLSTDAYNAYDATYIVTNAIAAAGSSQISGEEINRNIKRLQSGPRIPTGSADIQKGISLLQNNGSITLDTIFGPLIFNDGARPAGAGLFCVEAVNGVASKATQTPYAYDVNSGAVVGVPTGLCP